jgi:peptide/nickel transport system permease protein
MSDALTFDVDKLRSEARRRAALGNVLSTLWGNKKALVGSIMLLVALLAALLAPALAPFDPYELYVGPLIAPPGGTHLLGTDNFGRDAFSRLLYGARISLVASFSVTALSLVVGVSLGLITGYVGGTVDYVVMRVIDMFFAFPWILIALAIAAIIGPGLDTVLIALVAVYSPILTRVTRGVVLSIREKEYVEAARAIGESDLSVMFRYILPNTLSPLIVQSTAIMGFCIRAEAAISYLGLGTRPPTPSWGLSLAEGGPFMWAGPHLVVFPGLAIAYLVLSFNFLGDGLRDIFDPRYQG